MPELVACPACGCKVQLADALLGRRTRCIACGDSFTASDSKPAKPPTPETYPVRPPEYEEPEVEDAWQRGPARHRMPLCPLCHWPVSWDALACPRCSHLFDPEDQKRPPSWERRRDGESHRGKLIDTLGTICLICAVMSLCTAGLGSLIALGTGLPALVMAGTDLERMRRQEIDDEGRPATELGRNKAIVGLVLAILFGLCIALYFIDPITLL